MTPEPKDQTPPADALRLVADLMGQSMSQTHDLTNSIIDSLSEDLAETRAIVDLIRDQIENLVQGDYMPTPDALIRALYPYGPAVSERATEILRRQGTHSSTH